MTDLTPEQFAAVPRPRRRATLASVAADPANAPRADRPLGPHAWTDRVRLWRPPAVSLPASHVICHFQLPLWGNYANSHLAMQPPLLPLTAFLRGMISSIVFAMTTLCTSGKLTWKMSGLILERFNRVKDRIARTAARIEAGRYAPRRRSGPPKPPAIRRPRQPGPLPREFGWLATLMPATAQSHRGDLDGLLRHPEMVALIAAAPVTLIPPLRSLCWALRLAPPPNLARPRKATAAPPSPKPQAPAPQPAAPQPTPPPSPSQSQAPARQPESPPPRVCGPPNPA